MVIPFALAVGGYSLILFLSIYATSCSLYQCVESAAPSRATTVMIDDFALRRDVAVDDVDAVDTMESLLSRRLWDPGIRLNVNTMTTTMEACNESNPVDRIDRPPIDLTPASTMSTDFLLLSAWLLLSTMLMSPIDNDNRTSVTVACHRDGAASFYRSVPTVTMASAMSTVATAYASVGWQSLFHYSHPVLSRPTVPNIDT